MSVILVHVFYAYVGDLVYQAYGKRTLPPMAVFAGTVFIALVGTVIFYKELTNKTLSGDKKKGTEVTVVHATNQVYFGKQIK